MSAGLVEISKVELFTFADRLSLSGRTLHIVLELLVKIDRVSSLVFFRALELVGCKSSDQNEQNPRDHHRVEESHTVFIQPLFHIQNCNINWLKKARFNQIH